MCVMYYLLLFDGLPGTDYKLLADAVLRLFGTNYQKLSLLMTLLLCLSAG